MSITSESVLETIHAELVLASVDLTQAKRAQQDKDTPAARRHVHTCRERVDALLDMWNVCFGGA